MVFSKTDKFPNMKFFTVKMATGSKNIAAWKTINHKQNKAIKVTGLNSLRTFGPVIHRWVRIAIVL